jgi:citrate synthase
MLINMKKPDALYLSAREAAAELAISPATLYAYVSRGLIRSEPSSDSRSHRYRAEDVRGLKERRVPSPEPRGLRSFDPDLPVLDSAISTITENGPIYRGVNCVELAERDTLEHTATLLWDVTGVDPFAADNCPHVSDEMRAVAAAARRAAPIDRAIAVLALATSADPGAFTRAHDGRAMVGVRILRLMIATMLNSAPSAEALHLQIAQAWSPDNKHAADIIRRALVLLADHELNASTFTVRCAASTGLNLYDAVIAGLVALKGPKHGGAGVLASRLVKTLVDNDVAPVIRERVALGERFAGFGHGVYKHGDPRALSLLNALTRAGAPRKFTREVPERIAEATGEFVNIDYALAVMAHSLRLAPGSELTLFAMARAVGWIAHASEQLQTGGLIRPRARYVGPVPGRGAASSITRES